MRLAAISILTLTFLTGCVSVNAHLPEDMVRHMARQDGVDIGAVCSHDGKSYSEGAGTCMAGRHMTCDPTGRWARDGEC